MINNISTNFLNKFFQNTASNVSFRGYATNPLERTPDADGFYKNSVPKTTDEMTEFSQQLVGNDAGLVEKFKNLLTGLVEKTQGFLSAIHASNVYSSDCTDKETANINAKLSADAYRPEAGKRGCGDWKFTEAKDNEKTGFHASVYENDGKIIIAYRGTNDETDFTSDMQMIDDSLPDQYADANKLYNDIKAKYPNKTITLTGHSLGGALAQLVASTHKETKAVTYDAVGTKAIVNKNGLKDNNNSFNYIIENDPISNATEHVGKTSLLKATNKNSHAIQNFTKRWEN